MTSQFYAAKTITQVLKGSNLDTALSTLANDIDNSALIRELCYGSLRYYHQLSAFLQLLLRKPLNKLDIELQALLLIGIYQLHYLNVPDYAAINETVQTCHWLKKKWAKRLVNGILRNFQRQRETLVQRIMDDDVANYSHPSWLLQAFKHDWPKQWHTICQANNRQADLNLRVNLQKCSRADYLQILQAQAIQAQPNRWSLAGIRLLERAMVTTLPGFDEGYISVQDEAAQLAAYSLDLQAGQRVLDACAAPGGKTGHLLELESSIQLTAIEKDKQRAIRIEENLQRLQLAINNIIIVDAADVNEWWDGQGFDRILLDAPCSATGVIRRHPDIKLLRRTTDIPALQHQQLRLLTALWPLLQPQGKLLYATCSVLAQENEQVIARFLTQHDDAQIEQLPVNCGVALPNGRQLLPEQNSHDGFYYALLTKK